MRVNDERRRSRFSEVGPPRVDFFRSRRAHLIYDVSSVTLRAQDDEAIYIITIIRHHYHVALGRRYFSAISVPVMDPT